MPAKASVFYQDTPQYQEAITHFQKGNWEAGQIKLSELIQLYPLESELRAFRQEMSLRSRIDDYEREDKVKASRRWFGVMVFRILVISVVIGIVYWGARTYLSWIQAQVSVASQSMESELQTLELAIRFRNAQNLLYAGRPEEAMVIFEDIAEINPDYPGLDNYLLTSQETLASEERYLKAISLLGEGNHSAALAELKGIYASDPTYKDVAIRIDTMERDQMLAEMLSEADTLYDDGQWLEAIDAFTSLRSLDLQYNSAHVEARLFESYLRMGEAVLEQKEIAPEDLDISESYFRKALALRPLNDEALNRRAAVRAAVEERLFWKYVEAAHTVLAQQSDSLDALAVAEEYFRLALQLRPDDGRILLERELASKYLQAQADFNQGLWDEVIDAMETICEVDMQYALGTAWQTLYEAYLARGSSSMASGQSEDALSDFRRAIVIAGQESSGVMRLYEAEVKLADALGTTGEYEEAIKVYQQAIETAGLRDRAAADNPAIIAKLDEAARYLSWGNYRMSYRLFQEALRGINQVYEVAHHVVTEGEYLNQLASRYHSTVSAIVDANDIADPNKIYVGQELIIPILP